MSTKQLRENLTKLVDETIGLFLAQFTFPKGTKWDVNFRGGESDDESDDMEMIIYFEDANGVFDVLEYLVSKKGRQINSLEAVKVWLLEDLKSVKKHE